VLELVVASVVDFPVDPYLNQHLHTQFLYQRADRLKLALNLLVHQDCQFFLLQVNFRLELFRLYPLYRYLHSIFKNNT
jgi:hypothetical protein